MLQHGIAVFNLTSGTAMALAGLSSAVVASWASPFTRNGYRRYSVVWPCIAKDLLGVYLSDGVSNAATYLGSSKSIDVSMVQAEFSPFPFGDAVPGEYVETTGTSIDEGPRILPAPSRILIV
jgi:hypothetical protein